ncbi:MAG: hypothetical protein KatS3mg120_0346 [Erythrobacter sp.]|nr:MAG: hypothetical protein KatS3mg120_0346 [Erythrobacter sp.]
MPAGQAAPGAPAASPEAAAAPASATAQAPRASLARRMGLIAAGWIFVLLLGGGLALERTLTRQVEANFDEQLDYILTAMIASAEIDPNGEVYFYRTLGDQRFLEPGSGLYWQISGGDFDPWPSRSLWDRTLRLKGTGQKGEQFDSHDAFLRFRPVPGRALADCRAHRDPARLGNPLDLRGGQRHRADGPPDRARAADPDLELCRARPWPAGDGAAADPLWPLAAAAGARGDPEAAQHRGQSHHRSAAARGAAAGRGTQCPARALRAPGRGGAPPCGQPCPCAQDAAHRADQRRHRARGRICPKR